MFHFQYISFDPHFEQVTLLIGQAVTLGYLANYFTLHEPSPHDTFSAYLLATGEVCTYVCICDNVLCIANDCVMFQDLC